MERRREPTAARAASFWRRLLLGLLLACAAGSAPAQRAGEYEVKAAFLTNFAKYVEWPARAFDSPTAPLRVCVLGENPFGSVLEAFVAAERKTPRPLRFEEVESAEAAAACHIVYLGRRLPELRRDLARLGDRPVLTVGEGEAFAEEGGIIAFRLERGRVRLTVNLATAQRAGLKISSRLLRLARVLE